MFFEARKQSMAWMEMDYSKHTYFRWKIKWRLEHLGALGTMGEMAPIILLNAANLLFTDQFAIVERPVNSKVFIGGDVKLTCGVITMLNSSLEVILEWTKYYSIVTPTERIKVQTVSMPPVHGMVKKRLILAIRNARYSDAALYTCTAALSGKTPKTSQALAVITVQGGFIKTRTFQLRSSNISPSLQASLMH